MNQKPSHNLVTLAASEGFHLTPIYDRRLFSAHDSRLPEGTRVFVDGKEIEHVRRAYVGADGWVDAYEASGDGDLAIVGDELVLDRHFGSVRIVCPNGDVFE